MKELWYTSLPQLAIAKNFSPSTYMWSDTF